jgi:abortive infection bacteriophage resistance protein
VPYKLWFKESITLYDGLAKDKDKKKIARSFELYPPLLGSWLHTITVVRNICAHHARLWNRELGIIPINSTIKGFSWPVYLDATHQHTHLSIVLSILAHMMRRINSQNTWRDQLFSLFETFNEIPISSIGLPADWKEDNFWK